MLREGSDFKVLGIPLWTCSKRYCRFPVFITTNYSSYEKSRMNSEFEIYDMFLVSSEHNIQYYLPRVE